MDLSLNTKSVGGGDYRWLGSKHARDTARTATIDVSTLTAGTDYDANGVIPSGTPLGKITATGLYGVFDAAATDGTEVLAGFLLEPEALQANFAGVSSAKVSVPLLVHGIINVAFVPGSPTLNTQTPTTGEFVFADVDYAAPAGA